ncbi:[acyl-carrier-protein] S-malonyltransferase [Hahella sp. CCB-MM4]|uniref:ACP S-malonyltransferase n=1 Tax=Hahella sp. (strain CCB-MM4) TaxID=1926491 RepID=UPI000B9B3A1E|nr:ACP S-malonyltransferase [Hahella sp. CCB-MM4]OZG70447.1 [acyl-carrier-protein] S-malonyltransferase [Hahella sp. CCB-MM4]
MTTYLFPGQGSQSKGMGQTAFDDYPDLVAQADEILGYSIKKLCLEDPDNQLNKTQYTQPALYVANALLYLQHLQRGGTAPDFLAGHSLGEYNALQAAGVMSFADGLSLVKKRGELMSKAVGGAMAAIVRVGEVDVERCLTENNLIDIDIANYNSPTQTVLSGLEKDLEDAQPIFEKAGAMFIPLNTSGAFHSRYMENARTEFAEFLNQFKFSVPGIPVVSNVSAQPHDPENIRQALADQITHSVRWTQSIRYLLGQRETDFVEIGGGDILTKMVKAIQSGEESPRPRRRRNRVTPGTTQNRRTESDATSQEILSPQRTVEEWNSRAPVGTRVHVTGYDELFVTRSIAKLLFGIRAVVYMEGYKGYFSLTEVTPEVTNV